MWHDLESGSRVCRFKMIEDHRLYSENDFQAQVINGNGLQRFTLLVISSVQVQEYRGISFIKQVFRDDGKLTVFKGNFYFVPEIGQ